MATPWQWLGRAGFRTVLDQQLAARERVWAGEPGMIFLCEHPPVITLGRSATPANILAAGDIPIERIERGGEVTYHGPGQLMVYPVVRLRGVVAFLEHVAAAIGRDDRDLARREHVRAVRAAPERDDRRVLAEQHDTVIARPHALARGVLLREHVAVRGAPEPARLSRQAARRATDRRRNAAARPH